jgi:hypothetical protein
VLYEIVSAETSVGQHGKEKKEAIEAIAKMQQD